MRISAGEMYLTICIGWAEPVLYTYRRAWASFWSWFECNENDFHIFLPSDLAIWPLVLNFAAPFILGQLYVSTTAFLFSRKSEARYGRTGAVQHLVWP